MSSVMVPTPTPFTDRRDSATPASLRAVERRQFANSHAELSPEARELATAVDQYKLRHRRRFINYDEMLALIKSLGYQRDAASGLA